MFTDKELRAIANRARASQEAIGGIESGTRLVDTEYRIHKKLMSDVMIDVYLLLSEDNRKHVSIAFKNMEVHPKRVVKHQLDAGDYHYVSQLISYQNTVFCIGDLIEYPSLAEWLMEKKSIKLAEFEWLISNLLLSVQKMHHEGVIHGYLNANNVFLSPKGIKLAGLGVHCKLDEEVVLPIEIINSIPPEVYCQTGELGPWTDIYSLGKLFQLLEHHLIDAASLYTKYLNEKLIEKMVANTISLRFKNLDAIIELLGESRLKRSAKKSSFKFTSFYKKC